jgi:hypothetical protein
MSVFWYLDDVVIASSSYEQHLDHPQQLFHHLQAHRLVINLVKFVFAASKMEFLCHEISVAGAKPICSHKEAFGSFSMPSTFKELQAFPNLVNFCRHFMPGAAKILRPMTDVLRGSQEATNLSRGPLSCSRLFRWPSRLFQLCNP